MTPLYPAGPTYCGREVEFRYDPLGYTNATLFADLQSFLANRFGTPVWRQQLLQGPRGERFDVQFCHLRGPHATGDEPLGPDAFGTVPNIPAELTLVVLAPELRRFPKYITTWPISVRTRSRASPSCPPRRATAQGGWQLGSDSEFGTNFCANQTIVLSHYFFKAT